MRPTGPVPVGQQVMGPLNGAVLSAVCKAQASFLKDAKKYGITSSQRNFTITAASQGGLIVVTFGAIRPTSFAERRTYFYAIDRTSLRVVAVDIANPNK